MPDLKAVLQRYSAYVFEVEWLPANPGLDLCKTLVVAKSFDEAVSLVTPNINDVKSVIRVNHVIERRFVE